MQRRLAAVLLAVLVAAGGGAVGAVVASAAVPLGGVVAWGDNSYGQTGNQTAPNGDGTSAAVQVPTGVAGLSSGVAAISSHADHTLALMTDGTVRSWGFNAAGQLGNGLVANTDIPQTVRGIGGVGNLGGVTAIATGDGHSLALLSDGSIAAWGYNSSGQLGDTTTTDRWTPVVITLPQPAVAIAAGDNSSFAITAGGLLYAWGDNDHGQLATGDTVEYRAPHSTGLSGVVQVSSGHKHTLLLLNDGTLRGVGANASGQLGNGSTADSIAPVNPGLTGVAGVAAGGDHTLALMAAGTVQAWGGNAFGQLGNNSTIDSPTPLTVPAVTNVAEIAAGGDHSVALLNTGGVVAWGQDSMGELGDNLQASLPRPPSNVVDTSGSGTLSGVYQVAAGDEDTYALGGTPGQAGLIAKPTSLDFGSVIAGTVHHFGTVAMFVTGSALNHLAGMTGPALPFSVFSNPCATLALMPGAVCFVTFEYRPVGTGTDSGAATQTSTAPPLIIPLTGRSVRYGPLNTSGMAGEFMFGESCPANAAGEVARCFIAGDSKVASAPGGGVVLTAPIDKADGTPSAGSPWTRPFIGPTGSALTSISCADASTTSGKHNLYCYAVGGQGLLAYCITGGDCASAWNTAAVAAKPDLYGVSCVDKNNCAAVGSGGRIIQTTSASTGGPWLPAASGTSSYLLTVSCLTVGTCYAGGQDGLVLVGSIGGAWVPDDVVLTPGHDINVIACAGSGKRFPCFAGADTYILKRAGSGPAIPHAWAGVDAGHAVLGLACGGDPIGSNIDCTATGYSGTSLDSIDGTTWALSAPFTNDELDGAACFYNSRAPAFGFCNVFGQDPLFASNALFGRTQLTQSQPRLALAGPPGRPPVGAPGPAQHAPAPSKPHGNSLAGLPLVGGWFNHSSTTAPTATTTDPPTGSAAGTAVLPAGGPAPALLDPGSQTVPGRVGVAARDLAFMIGRSGATLILLLALVFVAVAVRRRGSKRA